MQINDEPEAKPWWLSITNWSQIGVAIAFFTPPKYKALVGPTAESIGEIVLIVVAVIGRWRAGGVTLPMIGAKQK